MLACERPEVLFPTANTESLVIRPSQGRWSEFYAKTRKVTHPVVYLTQAKKGNADTYLHIFEIFQTMEYWNVQQFRQDVLDNKQHIEVLKSGNMIKKKVLISA